MWDAERQWYVAREVLAAGCGCVIVDSLFNPLEVLKVRLQRSSGSSNVDVSNSSSTNRGFRSLVQQSRLLREARLLIAERGSVLGLWTPGLFPTQLRGFFYVGVRIGLYPTAKSIVPIPPDEFLNKLIAGALCGALGSTLFTPLDVVRIRLQSNAAQYPSTWSAFAEIYRSEGVSSGLWRGATANVLRATILSGTQLACYDQLKGWLRALRSHLTGRVSDEEGLLLHAAASFCSGTIAQVVAMPADALKTAVMLPANANASAVTTTSGGAGGGRGSISCGGGGSGSRRLLVAAQYIHRRGGWRGFYGGMLPALMRQGPCILVQMPVIEQLRRLFGLQFI